MLLGLSNFEHHFLLLAFMKRIEVVNLQRMFSHNKVKQLALPGC
jgi:hypothetical protein